mgnify:FL=1
MMKRRIRRGFCAVLAMAMLLEGNVSVTLAAVASDKIQEVASENSAELEVVEKWDVKANESLEEDKVVSNLTIYPGCNLNLNGHQLTVKGNVYQKGGSVRLSKGTFLCEGNYDFEGSASLSMKDQEDVLVVQGDFTSTVTRDAKEIEAGIVRFGGNFIQKGNDKLRNFITTGTSEVIFNGEKVQNIEFQSPYSYFSKVTLKNTSTEGIVAKDMIHSLQLNRNGVKIQSDVHGSYGWKLTKDEEVEGDLVLIGDTLNLNGHTLKVKGNLVHKNGMVNIQGGTLKVAGNYQAQSDTGEPVSAQLISKKVGGSFEVAGDIIESSIFSHNSITEGTILLEGNLLQNETKVKDNFVMSGNSTLVLNGNEKQKISFASSGKNDSRLQNWEIKNSAGVELASNIVVMGKVTDYNNSINGAALILQKSTTFAERNYNGNVNVYDWTTLDQLQRIGGNLNIRNDAQLKHNLVVEGDVNAEDDFDVNNYMLEVQGSIYTQQGFNINAGKVICKNNFEMPKEKNGHIKMANAAAYLLVEGDFYVGTKGEVSENLLRAGVLEIKGDFTQETTRTAGNFRASGVHKAIFTGNKEQKIVFSDNKSYFNIVEIDNAEGIYAPQGIYTSKLELNGSQVRTDMAGKVGWKLEKDEIIEGDFELSSGEMDLNGYTMTVKGTLLQSGGSMNVNGGKLVVEKDYRIQSYKEGVYGESAGQLLMNKQEDNVEVEGSFIMGSVYSHKNKITEGTIKIKGDVTGISYTAKDNFAVAGKSKFILNGDNSQRINLSNPNFNEMFVANLEIQNDSEEGVVFETVFPVTSSVNDHGNTTEGQIMTTHNTQFTDNSYAGDVKVHGYGAITSLQRVGGNLTISYMPYLANDMQVEGDLILHNSVLELKGKCLQIQGNVIINGGHINLMGGSLLCGKDLNLANESNSASFLVMKNDKDYILVNGNMLVESDRTYGETINKGLLEIKGDFKQSVQTDAANFMVDKECKVIFSGEKKQTVIFESEDSYFSYVKLENTSAEGVYAPTGINCKELNVGETNYNTDLEGRTGWKLTENEVIEGDLELVQGTLDLNGKTLVVEGNLLQRGGCVNINGGKLVVEQDYSIQKENNAGCWASLKMNEKTDYVEVQKDFTMASYADHAEYLTAGQMFVYGDFIQKKTKKETNFYSQDDFRLIMCGDKMQSIQMQNSSQATSHIANLEINHLGDTTVELNDTTVTGEVEIKQGKTTGYLAITNTTKFKDKKFLGSVVVKESTSYPEDLFVKGSIRVLKDLRLKGNIHVGKEFISYNNVNLQGCQLTIDGDAHINQGRVFLNEGQLICHGNMTFEYAKNDFSGVDMRYAKDYICVDGNLYLNSAMAMTLTDGILELKGNFIQSQFSVNNTFMQKQNGKTVASGTKKQTFHFADSSSQFGTLVLKNESDEGVYLDNMSIRALDVIRNNCRITCNGNGTYGWTLREDTVLEGDVNIVTDTLDLNGHKLIVNGNLYISSGKLKIDGGELEVNGDLRIQGFQRKGIYYSGMGTLIMQNKKDVVRVKKDFIVQTRVAGKGLLTEGELHVCGNFWQLSEQADEKESFTPSDNHKVVFDGTEKQTISFAETGKSWFRNVKIDSKEREVELLTNVLCEGEIEDEAQKTYSRNNTYMMTINHLSQLKNGKFGGDINLKKADDLTQNVTIKGKLVAPASLNLQKYVLKVGEFKKTNGKLNIQEGRFYVENNFNMSDYASLTMDKSAGYMQIKGDTELSVNSALFTAGTSEFCGSVKVLKNLTAGESHKTILSGKKIGLGRDFIQQISFKNDINKWNIMVLKKNPNDCYVFSKEAEQMCNELRVEIQDEEAPTKVQNVVCKKSTATTAELSWDEAEDNEKVEGYWVYRNSKLLGTTSNTFYTDIELTPATSYQYQIAAFDAAENSSEISESIEVMTKEDIDAPSTPSDVNIYSQTGTALTISWTKSQDNVGTIGYEVYRDGDLVATIEGAGKTSYRDVSCKLGQKYSYQVLAFDKVGNKSEKSKPIEGELLAPQIQTFNIQEGQVIGGEEISLVVKFDNHGNYQSDKVCFEYSKDNGVTWLAINQALLGQKEYSQTQFYCGCTWNLRKLTSGTYKVRATLYDMDENKDVKEVSCAIDKNGAKPPEYVYAESESGVVELEWSESPTATCAEYEIYRECGDEQKKLAVLGERNKTNYLDSDVKEGMEYQYQIIAVDKFGQKGVPSKKVSVVASKDTECPIVKNLYAKTECINDKSVLWVEASDNINVEKVWIQYRKNNEWITVAELQGDQEHSGKLENLPTDGTYEFRAVAVDAAGNKSIPYSKNLVIDRTGVKSPENLKVSVQNQNVRFTWEAPQENDFDYYAVEQKIGGEYKQIVKEGKKAGVYVKNLQHDTEYQFRVVGYDTVGNRGEASDEIKVRTEIDREGPYLQKFTPAMPYYRDSIPLSFVCKDDEGLSIIRIICSSDKRQWDEVQRIDLTQGEKIYSGTYDLDITDYPEGELYVRFILTDVNGNVSGKARSIMERKFYHDTTPPDPVKLQTKQSGKYLHLEWQEPEAKDAVVYDVYRLNADTGEYECVKRNTHALKYYDDNCVAGTIYFYTVKAKDYAGNCSDFSNVALARFEQSNIYLKDTPPVEVCGLVGGTKDADGNVVVGENAKLHAMVYGDKPLADVTISYRKKGTNDKWKTIYQTQSGKTEQEIYVEWKNSHLEDGEYEFRVSAKDEEGNYAQSYTKIFVLKKKQNQEKPNEEPNTTDSEKTSKINAVVNLQEVQRVGTEYVFDASESTGGASAIKNYEWDFGDGTTGKGVAPTHTYQATGEYTVTLTLTDFRGNKDSFMQKIESVAKKSGGIRVSVKAENGSNLSDTVIQIQKSPNGKVQEVSTDYNGVYESALKNGTYTVSVYKSGYLPKQQTVKVKDGIIKDIKFTLQQHEVVTGEVSHRKLDMREIIELGVDLENQDNWYIIEYTDTYVEEDTGEWKQRRRYLRDREFVSDGGGEYSGYIGAGGGSGKDKNDGIYVHYVKRKIAFLKQMFEVELELTNHASKEFSITNNKAKLSLPDGGLSFIDFEDKRVQNTTVEFDDFPGEMTKKLNWYIRGDQPGEYSLSVDYSGRLQPFDEEITAHIVDPEPVKVTLENENTSTDPEFLEDESNPQTYLLSVRNLVGEKISGAYVELDYNGTSTRAITDSEGDAYLEVKKEDYRVFTLTVTKKGYPDYVDEYYTLCNEGSDTVHIGGKNNDGASYPDENTSYKGDFALLDVLVDDHNLMDSEKRIDRCSGKDVTFVLKFSDKITSAKIIMEKDEKRNDLESKSSTISKNKKELRMVVDPKKLKVGSLFHIEAVDEEEGILHKYTLRNVRVIDSKYDNLPKKTIDISLNKIDRSGSVTATFDPKWLTKSTNIYNHELAQFNMALASVAYCEDDGDEYKTLRNKNYYDALTALGFKVDGGEYCLKLAQDNRGGPTKKEDSQTIHYYLASNKYKIVDSEMDVVILTLRGTKGNEWYDNFDIDLHNVGEDKGKNCRVHDGFNNGASAVKKALKEYIRVNNLTSNTKIIITGHSRGAAVTNLLAAQLGEEENMFKGREGDQHKADVFAYAYACPNTVTRAETLKKNYDNIFNFVNPQDFVTKVVPSTWGFGRYGTTYVFPSSVNGFNELNAGNMSKDLYDLYMQEMQKKFSAYWKGKEYEAYFLGINRVSELIDLITMYVGDVSLYYKRDLNKFGVKNISPSLIPEDWEKSDEIKSAETLFQGKCLKIPCVTLRDVFQGLLSKTMVEGLSSLGVKKNIGLALLSNYGGDIGFVVMIFFGVHKATFEYSHTYETYLAMINSVPEDVLKSPKKLVKGIINCPVDLEVYNSDNELVGRIKDNKIDTSIESERKVDLEVIGDSKQFKINASLNYKIKLTGNADGKMDYILSTEDLDAGEEQRILFKDISVSNKRIMEMNISPDVSLKDQSLRSENGKEIHYDQLLEQGDLNTLSVTTEVQGRGTASSFANLTYGDAVVLKAETDENNEFIGWYDEKGNFVSKEPEYPIVVTKNRTYQARFTNCFVQLQNYQAPDVVQMEIGDKTSLAIEVVPHNATVKTCILESLNQDIVQVDDYGILQARKAGVAKIKICSPDEKIVCYTTVVVGKDTPVPSISPRTTEEPAPSPNASKKPVLPTPCTSSVPEATEKPNLMPSASSYPMGTSPGRTDVLKQPYDSELTPTEQKKKDKKLKKNKRDILSNIRIKRIKRKKRGIYIEFTKVKKATKYEIQWSTTKTFKKPKTITLKKNKYLLKCKKKKLYFRIRARRGKKKGKWTKYIKER